MAAFARAMGMRPQNLHQYLTGEHPIGPGVREKLRSIGCDVDWLLSGQSNTAFTPDTIELTTIPVYDNPENRFANGAHPVELIHVENKGDETRYGVIVRGTAMVPELRNGDIVIATKMDPPRDGDLAIVTLRSGETFFARIHRQHNAIMCAFVNPAAAPRVVSTKQIEHMHRIIERITRY